MTLKLRLQARVDGWRLDDIVAEFPGANDRPKFAAVSAKKEPFVNTKGFDDEFVKECWQQLVHPGSTGFTPADDRLVLCCGNLPSTVRDAVKRLVNLATGDPQHFMRRVRGPDWTNDKVRTLVNSFACPADVAANQQQRDSQGALLHCVRVVERDWLEVNSHWQAEALTQARGAVESGSEAEAEQLWRILRQLAQALSGKSGSIDLAIIKEAVRGQVALRAFPDYAVVWRAIRSSVETWRSEVRTSLAGAFTVPRQDLAARVQKGLGEHKLTVIVGSSGTGKSAVVRTALDRAEEDLDTLILAGRWTDFERLASAHGDAFRDTLTAATRSEAIFVLDSAEQMLVSRQEGNPVLRVLDALDVGASGSPWRVVVVTQTGSSDAVVDTLEKAIRGFPVPHAVEVVDEFTDHELRLATAEFPALSPLLQHATQRRILARPIVLDRVVRGLTSGIPGTFANLTAFHDWFWRHFVAKEPGGDARAAVAKNLARDMAETGAHRVPVDNLSIAELNHLGELVQQGILTRSREVVAFAHDSYAALARERVLLGRVEANGIASLPEKLTGWHDAVALLSLRLIEAGSVGGIEWEQLYALLVERDPQGAPFAATSELFAAADVAAAFKRALPTLLKDEGDPLRKMLQRMAFSWSVLRPDLADSVAGLDRGVQWRIDSRIESRFPTGDHWPRLIAWLARQDEAVLGPVQAEVFDLCRLWMNRALLLRWNALPESRTAAHLILKQAEALCRGTWPYRGPSSERLIATALLCHAWFPRRTLRAIRALAGVEPCPLPKELCPQSPAREHSRPSSPSVLTLLRGRKPAPWELGPYRRPSSGLRKVVLSSPGADYLVEADVNIAQRVFYGAIILSPSERRQDRLASAAGIVARVASPPTCWFPPVRALLARSPNAAASFVARLVDFGTSRWLERAGPTFPRPGCTLDLPDGSQRHFLGDGGVFAWSRGSSRGPGALKAALMTLEDWFYESLGEEATQEVARQVLRQLLSESCSVAVLGMLCDVGIRFPALLLSDLQPLVTGRELYLWVLLRRPMIDMSMSRWWGEPLEDQQRIRQFHELAHRNVDFRSLVARMFIESDFDWPAVTTARSRWLADPVEGELYFEVLAAHFDQGNWTENAEEDATMWELQLPRDLQARTNEEQRVANELSGDSLRPFTWASMLDGESPVDEAAVLQELQRFVEELGGDQPEPAQTVAVAAVAAVALVRCPAVLERDPNLAEQCRRWLLDMCSHPPPSEPLDDRFRATLVSWDEFCAFGVATVWAQNPRDTDARHAIALLSVGPRNGTCRKLLERATQHRKELGVEFELLVDLVVFVARALHAIRWSRRPGQVHEWAWALHRAIGEFVAGRSFIRAARWEAVAVEEDPLARFGRWGSRIRTRLRRILRRPPSARALAELEPWINIRAPLRELPEAPIPSGVDGTTLFAGVSWLLDEVRLTDAPDAGLERAVQELARVTVLPAVHGATEAARRPRGGDRKPIPRDEDRELTDVIAAHVARFPSGIDTTVACWGFDLPASCGYWLEDLIRSVYLEWVRYNIDFATRARVLAQVVPHALRWCSDGSDSGYRWRDRDVLSHLLGTQCGRPIADVWPAEAAPSVATLATCLKSWWVAASPDPSCVAAFCGFLRAPGCDQFRGQGLSWIEPCHVRSLESVEWWIGELVSLLELTAPTPPPPSTAAHWRALLDAACEQGDAGALALSERWNGTPS